MATIRNFMTDEQWDMHEALGEWCEENCDMFCNKNCPFFVEEDETDTSKFHWCHCDGLENGGLHPNFLEVLEKDYKYLTNTLLKTGNTVNHPEHYNQGGIECIDAMISAFGKEATAHFCIVNAFKYVWRASNKNGMEDIDKAIWYLNKYKELSE